MNKLSCLFTLFCITLLTSRLAAQDRYIVFENKPGAFPLSVSGKPAPIYVSDVDHTGVIRAAKDLQTDIGRVTGATPSLFDGCSFREEHCDRGNTWKESADPHN